MIAPAVELAPATGSGRGVDADVFKKQHGAPLVHDLNETVDEGSYKKALQPGVAQHMALQPPTLAFGGLSGLLGVIVKSPSEGMSLLSPSETVAGEAGESYLPLNSQ